MRKIFFTSVLTTSLLLALLPAPSQSLADESSVPPIAIIESNADRLVLGLTSQEITLQNVTLMDENQYTVVYTSRAGTLEAGKPNVPVLREWILVPNGNSDVDVHLEINPGEPTQTRYPEHPLAPLQYSTVDLEDAPMREFTINEAAYAQDEFYPGRFASLDPIQLMRGQNIARLQVYPYQYNPFLQRLDIYHNMVLTVTFDSDVEPIPHALRDDDFDAMYRDLALNADEVLDAEDEVDPGEISEPGSYGWDYLIFTAPAFENAANTLASWKQQKGFKTLVTKIPANWVQDDIKFALMYAYETWDVKPKYVLLIGDAEYISPYYTTWHPYNTQKYKGNLNTQGYTGTDLYYSTLSSKNPFLPDEDLIPEVLLGRLSVDYAYEAMDRVNAIINYEKNPPNTESFYNTVAMAAEFQDGGTVEVYYESTGLTSTFTMSADGIEDKRFTQTSEDIAIFLQSSSVGKSIQRLYYGGFNRSNPSEYPQKWCDNKNKWFQDVVNFDGPTKNTTVGGNIPSTLKFPTYSWSANSSDISSAINNGAFLVTHRDHGGRRRWSNPAFEHTDVFLLSNMGKLPFVWSLNCQTGWFDNETDYKGKSGLADLTGSSEESFSEYWERPFASAISANDNGALAVVASTRVSYGSGNEPLAEGMTGAIWPKYLNPSSTKQPIYKLGAIMNTGKLYMSVKMSDGNEETAQLEGYHLFGDPSTELRTQKPLPMLVVADGFWPWGLHPHDYSALVKKEDDSPIERAKVTLKKSGDSSKPYLKPDQAGGSTDFWSGLTDVEGRVIFPDLTTTGIGAYDLVVTAPDFLPYESSVEIAPGPAGGIALDKEVYACRSEIILTVADSNRTGAAPVTLITGGVDVETIELPEVEPGLFAGGITSEAGGADSGDGMLQLADGVLITAFYVDEDNGSGGSEMSIDQAYADCQAPLFDGLGSIDVHGCSAHLAWEPAIDPHGLVTYNVYQLLPGDSPGYELVGNTWMPGFVANLCNMSPPYQFLVRAQDAPGNEETNDLPQSLDLHFLLLPLVSR